LKPVATIRRATTADAVLLAQIGEQSFIEAFAADNTPENMAAFVSGAFSPALTAAELAEPTHEFYLLEINHTPAGYLKLRWPAPNEQVPFKIC
jgi:hypothetical protein